MFYYAPAIFNGRGAGGGRGGEGACILAEKRNASINSGVVFLKKIVDFICLFNFFNSLFHFLLNAIGLVSYSRLRLQ